MLTKLLHTCVLTWKNRALIFTKTRTTMILHFTWLLQNEIFAEDKLFNAYVCDTDNYLSLTLLWSRSLLAPFATSPRKCSDEKLAKI